MKILNFLRLPNERNERRSAVVLIGLLFGVVLVSLSLIVMKFKTSKRWTIEQALWVTDKEMKNFYGPGTPQQQAIVDLLGADLEFSEPVLYRMGCKGSDTNEGLIMLGFDPTHPEAAPAMVAEK